MMRKIRFLSTAGLLAMTASMASAAPSNAIGNDEPLFSARTRFSLLENSQFDPQFNSDVFQDLAKAALSRRGISVDPRKRGKHHIFFDADYVYYVGTAPYRFITIRISDRNQAGKAECDVSQSAWFVGPTGANAMYKTFESVADGFFSNCIKSAP